MTTINLEPMVIDTRVAAARSYHDLMRVIAEAIGTVGYAEVLLVEGLWGVYVLSGEDELSWVPGTLTGDMLPLETLVEAYESKGWKVESTGELVTINFPTITPVVESDEDDDDE